MEMTGGRPGAGARWVGVVAWGLWGVTLLGLGATVWLDGLLRDAGKPELVWLEAGNIPGAVAAMVAATVGAVLADRRPRHPVGWLLLGLGVSLTLGSSVFDYSRYGLVGRPGALPGAGYLAGLSNAFVIVWMSCVGFILLLSPTGRLPSRRWRWWARIAAAAAALWVAGSVITARPLYPEYPDIGNPLAIPGLTPLLDAVIAPAAVVVLVGLVVAAVSLVLRFRRARGVERQQLLWLAWGAALAAAALVVAMITLTMEGDSTLFQTAVGVCLALLPLATGAAILRYRLYDLDRIISRTVAYALLTLLLGGGYAVVVLGLGQLLGRDSSLVVAGATLAVAAVFGPARRRVQAVVDRRFNRRRHDAATTIAAFSGRLRQQIDLDTLTAELLAVVDQTMQPTRSALWLRRP
jgi:hypothetical protein